MAQQDASSARSESAAGSLPPSPPTPPSPTGTSVRPAQAGGRDRFLLAIVGGTLLLVLVSVVIVLTFSRSRASAPADPSGPAGVVHGYVEAVRAGDTDRARGYLTRQAQSDFDARLRQNPLRPSPDDRIRIQVETISQTETGAEVKITISHFYGRNDPFSAGTSHRDTTTKLIREDDAWKISQPPQAYELT